MSNVTSKNLNWLFTVQHVWDNARANECEKMSKNNDNNKENGIMRIEREL